MIGRKGRCDNCQTKFIMEASAAVPATSKTKSNHNTLWLCVLLFVGATGIWALIQSQSDNHKTADSQTDKPDSAKHNETTGGTDQSVSENTPGKKTIASSPSIPPLEANFPVKSQFEKIDIREYQRTYPDVHQGWMPNIKEQAEEAKRWGSHLGPLGVRIRSHVPQLQGRPAFAANVPLVLQATNGSLALTAAEVVSIAPGSPADNHLQTGDLIIGIEGEMLKSGNSYRPDWNFMHKDARELQLMLGEKIDQAQARGDIRLSVMRFPKGTEKPLPVESIEIWSGKGGNQSVGVQSFDVLISGEGFVTLESHKFDDSIHGDGTVWLDVTVEGDFGSKKLLEINPQSVSAGYGRPHFKTEESITIQEKEYQQSLNLHAHGAAKWILPEGTKRIKGHFAAISYGKVQPKIHYTNLALPLTGKHKENVVELRFPIGKTGSFSSSYPKNCPKTDLTVTRHTEWLAAQQRDDGSWPRLRGYTRDGWDTAWCALALMSSGNSKYDSQIRKAAYKIAYSDAPSEWTAERAMRLIFLSEYYLRTKDTKIVPGIQAAYHQILDVCKTDFMAGHKVNGFGYGIAGQHYGTGHMALAIALASRTPITTNKYLVSNIIRHAGEVMVNGHYAYGRGRLMARDTKRKRSGGNAMSGPGALAMQIGGGHASSITDHTERIEASLGDGDNSHATSSLAFIFSSLATAAADEGVFIKHMQNFRYKMTIDDNWEGGILKSAFPLDFQGGEGVTSNWIRTAGTILVYNALKKNLAINGKKEFWEKANITTVAVSEWGGQIHSYYLRNWCLTKELLGNHTPQSITDGIKAMCALPRTTELIPKTREIVIELAPKAIKEITNNSSLTKTQRAYAIELLCGLDLKIYSEKKEDKQKIDLHVHLPLHQLNWLDTEKGTIFQQSPFPLQTKVTIQAENISDAVTFETQGTKDFNLDQGTRKLSVTKPLKDASKAEFDGTASIAFKIGENSVTYERLLKFNTEFAHSNNYNLRRLQLKLRRAPRAYFQSQPMIIAGIPFDCMYPQERMMEIQGPQQEVLVNSHEGDEVVVDLASENFICAWVHSIKYHKPTQVAIATAKEHRAIVGKINGDIENLYDFKHATFCDLVPSNGKSIIEYDFGKEITLNGVDTNIARATFIRVWYKKDDKWVPLVWDNYSVNTGHHPVFPDTKARFWRLEFQHDRNEKFHTLRFYYNSNMLLKHSAFPQSEDTKYMPPIQPE